MKNVEEVEAARSTVASENAEGDATGPAAASPTTAASSTLVENVEGVGVSRTEGKAADLPGEHARGENVAPSTPTENEP